MTKPTTAASTQKEYAIATGTDGLTAYIIIEDGRKKSWHAAVREEE